jgi:hypothetical protein
MKVEVHKLSEDRITWSLTVDHTLAEFNKKNIREDAIHPFCTLHTGKTLSSITYLNSLTWDHLRYISMHDDEFEKTFHPGLSSPSLWRNDVIRGLWFLYSEKL